MADLHALGFGGMHDDPDKDPSSLRFSVGNLVMFKTTEGWFDGEVAKVSQRLTLGSRTQYIPYIIWPLRENVDGTEWVEEDTMEFIKPRMENKTPDPRKFKPLLVVPDDPMHFLYTDIKKYDSTTDEGNEMADVFEKIDFVEKAETNPDGSINVKGRDGRQMTTACMQIPQEPICGVDAMTAIMYASNQITIRQSLGFNPNRAPDLVKIFESAVPRETSLSDLERKSKSSPRKMLQLADALMTGMNGWPRNPHRACTLYRAAAWGCTEEEEPERVGIPNGIPEGMLAAASLGINWIKGSILGYENSPDSQRVPFEEWLEGGLKSERGIDALTQIFHWVTHAVTVSNHLYSISSALLDPLSSYLLLFLSHSCPSFMDGSLL